MDNRRQQLLSQIALAFAGVELGDGVSLHESSVIDNYGTVEERLEARALDEKSDWRRLINGPELILFFRVGSTCPCFLDAAGLRFYLPACLFLIAQSINDEPNDIFEPLLSILTNISDYNTKRFAVLNDAQKNCVKKVLIYFRDVFQLHSEELNQAIANYWSTSSPERNL